MDDERFQRPQRKMSTPTLAVPEATNLNNLSTRKYSHVALPSDGSEAGGSRKDSSTSSTSSNKSNSKSRWRFPFFKKDKEPDTVSIEQEFLPVCPPVNLVKKTSLEDPNCAEMRRDIQEFFEHRKSPPDEEAGCGDQSSKADYGWTSPSSWGFIGPNTYSVNTKPRKLSAEKSVDFENLWALRVFKPVETTDNIMSKVVASSGFTYVTLSCGVESTAADLCQMLMRKFTSNRDLSRFRLYVVHRHTERLLGHEDQPVKILKNYLLTMGYTEQDQLNKIVREDHSYICRFVFREYPPAPPKSEDFTHAETASLNRPRSGGNALAGRARITERSAYLADANLAVIPTVMFLRAKSFEFIDLSRNTLLTLPDDLFEMLVNLKLLRIIGNSFTTVPKAILTCPSITHLDLSSNCLEGPSLSCLSSMPNLTHLNVSCNKIKSLPVELNKLKNLTNLDISSNYLTELGPCIWGLEELRELNASFNRISRIPDEISNLTNLKSLVLFGNALQYICPKLKELANLRLLDIRGNLLSSFDNLAEISSLFEFASSYNNITKLKGPSWPHAGTLSCAHNQITGVHISDYLYNLKKLDLSSNKIVSLPDDFFAYMTNLDSIQLQENELTKLPQSINLLSKLETLIAHGNSISDIDLQFSFLTHLTHLELHTNNIRSISADIWNAPALKVLNVSSNFLTKLPQAPISMNTLPLAKSLEQFLAADNRLSDEIGDVLALLKSLKVLNLSYNRIYDLGDSLRLMGGLTELYLSGNGMNAFPEDIDKCTSLQLLFINRNKLANLPAELGKNISLSVFDVQSNVLKYNISNWPYDWNWNFNQELQYLNLANNKKLEIKASFGRDSNAPLERSLTDFKSMHKLRLLDVTNVQVSPSCIPDDVTNLQIRHGILEQIGLTVSVAEYCGRDINFDIAEFVTRNFMGQEKDHLVGLFDGRGHDFVSSYLNDTLEDNLKMELRRMRQGDEFSSAIRRAFLSTNRDLSLQPVDTHKGSTACLLYLLENQLLIANVGDTMAVLSREGSAILLTTKHHPWARSEQSRIRDLGGYISLQGLVEGGCAITRAFGYHHLLPFVNANPQINEVILRPTDEFVLMATSSFWKVMTYQMAVDIARKERSDPDVAVQILRDMAIARGVTDSMKIVFVDFRGITSQEEGANVEKRRTAFKRPSFEDQVLSRLDDEIPPPKPPCAFVFTDIKDSTKLWSMMPNAMRVAIKQHNNIIRRLMRIHGGYEIKTEGDAFVIAFTTSINALRFCLGVQQQLLENEWPREILESPVSTPIYNCEGKLIHCGLSIRMGIHYGMADDEEDKVARRMDYHGIHVIIAARVSAAADGGQIFISQPVMDMVNSLPGKEKPDIVIHDLGMTQLKGLQFPEHLYGVYSRQLADRHRLRSGSVCGDNLPEISQLRNLSLSDFNPPTLDKQ